MSSFCLQCRDEGRNQNDLALVLGMSFGVDANKLGICRLSQLKMPQICCKLSILPGGGGGGGKLPLLPRQFYEVAVKIRIVAICHCKRVTTLLKQRVPSLC